MATSPAFLPGKSHGQRSLAGYSPWGCEGLHTTERLTHTPIFITEPPEKYVNVRISKEAKREFSSSQWLI